MSMFNEDHFSLSFNPLHPIFVDFLCFGERCALFAGPRSGVSGALFAEAIAIGAGRRRFGGRGVEALSSG